MPEKKDIVPVVNDMTPKKCNPLPEIGFEAAAKRYEEEAKKAKKSKKTNNEKIE